jgi:hypothetical protein
MAVGTSAGGAVTATLVEAPNNGVIVVSRYSGADAASPIGATVSGNTNGVGGACSGGADGAAYAFALTTGANNAWVYSAASMRERTHDPGAGFTERADFTRGSGGGAVGIAVQDRLVASAGAVSVDGTFSENVDWAMIGLEIRPGAPPVPAPDIALTPTAHDYGSVVVDSASVRTFDVRNDGTADLHVTATDLVGSADFQILSGGGAFTLTPGQTRNLDVEFRPAALGAASATLRISSDDADENPLDVPLNGVGVSTPVPDVAVSPLSHDYGDVLQGSSAGQTFEVRNDGSADLLVSATTLLGTDAAEFAIDSGAAPFPLTPGQTRELVVSFHPASLGPKSATLRIESDDPDQSVLDVALTGNGVDTSVLDVALTGNGVDTPPPAADIALEEIRTGGASASNNLSTSADLTAVNGDLYLATIAAKSFRQALSVSGLGLTWTRVAAQCGARGQTGLDVWMAIGVPSGDGPVSATIADGAKNAVLLVSRYSGVDPASPLGNVASANTNGMAATCSGGTDNPAYSLDLNTDVDRAVIYAAAAMRNKEHTPGAGFQERAEVLQGSSGSAASAAVMDRTVDTAQTVTVNGTFSADVDWAAIALEIKPAGALALAGTAHAASGQARDDRREGGEENAPSGTSGLESSLPETISLGGYPNPFRAQTTIDYALPQSSHVSIIIYNAQGREVRRLLDRVETRGFRSVRWNGRNNSGAPVGPGVYFLRMRTQDRTLMKKLVLRR